MLDTPRRVPPRSSRNAIVMEYHSLGRFCSRPYFSRCLLENTFMLRIYFHILHPNEARVIIPRRRGKFGRA